MAEIFTLVALPEDIVLHKLNGLRSYLYTNGFRQENKPSKSDVHISLAQGWCKPELSDKLKDGIKRITSGIKPFEVSYIEVTNKKRKPINKYPFEHSWVALLFEDKDLVALAHATGRLLKELGVCANDAYFEKIQASDSSAGNDQIANHMNLCNYCKAEKSDEAVKIIIETAPKSFLIDKIGYRNNDGSLLWTLKL